MERLRSTEDYMNVISFLAETSKGKDILNGKSHQYPNESFESDLIEALSKSGLNGCTLSDLRKYACAGVSSAPRLASLHKAVAQASRQALLERYRRYGLSEKYPNND